MRVRNSGVQRVNRALSSDVCLSINSGALPQVRHGESVLWRTGDESRAFGAKHRSTPSLALTYSLLAALRAARKSTTNFSYSRCRDSSSGCRRRDDGCTVARALGASFDDNTLPRSRVTRNDGPKTACAAVAPRQTNNFGLTRRNSASSQGRQAAISREFGF